MTHKTSFTYRTDGQKPVDGLHSASLVLKTLETLFMSCNDLQLFQRTPGYDPIDGISVILEDIRNAVDTAVCEMEKSTRHSSERYVNAPVMSQREDSIEANNQTANNPSEKTTTQTYPDLTAREAAIAATFEKGHPVEDIAKAVNLKRKTVENIISQLRDTGAIPNDADMDFPASATSA